MFIMTGCRWRSLGRASLKSTGVAIFALINTILIFLAVDGVSHVKCSLTSDLHVRSLDDDISTITLEFDAPRSEEIENTLYSSATSQESTSQILQKSKHTVESIDSTHSSTHVASTSVRSATVSRWTKHLYDSDDDMSCGQLTSLYGRYSSGSKSRRNKRIVNGEAVSVSDWPWMIYFNYYYDGRYQGLCTGFYIAKNYILTAAHCFQTNNKSFDALDMSLVDVYIKSGRNSTEEYTHDDLLAEPIKYSIRVHPDFESEDYLNDIAIIKLEREEHQLKFNLFDTNRPCLFKQSSDFTNMKYEFTDQCFIMGYGRSNASESYQYQPEFLKKADVRECADQGSNLIFNKELLVCTEPIYEANVYGDQAFSNESYVSYEDSRLVPDASEVKRANLIQFKGGYSYRGDSGGALLCKYKKIYYHSNSANSEGHGEKVVEIKWILTGIISHLYDSRDFHTRIEAHESWILKQIEEMDLVTYSTLKHDTRVINTFNSVVATPATPILQLATTRNTKLPIVPDYVFNDVELVFYSTQSSESSSSNRVTNNVANKTSILVSINEQSHQLLKDTHDLLAKMFNKVFLLLYTLIGLLALILISVVTLAVVVCFKKSFFTKPYKPVQTQEV